MYVDRLHVGQEASEQTVEEPGRINRRKSKLSSCSAVKNVTFQLKNDAIKLYAGLARVCTVVSVY